MRKATLRLIFIFSTAFLISSIFVLYPKSQPFILPLLEDHLYPNNYTSIYENVVLLSCSSDSYTLLYCYYLPYVALAWRRIGFEPFVLLVGSEKAFRKMPLMNLLENDLKMQYFILNVDSARSISTSQLIRLFGGFLSYQHNTTKDLFLITADADLIPISRHRFQVDTGNINDILVVNAYCCPGDAFSYGDYPHVQYYPMSFIGMTKTLWKKIFLPLEECHMSANLTTNMIECSLGAKMNTSIPKNVIKATKQWDIDQKLISLLITQSERLYGTYVDKRKLGHRLDPDQRVLSDEFEDILYYDDVHLPNKHAHVIFSNRTWLVFSQAFASLFSRDTIQLLSNYHHQTTAIALKNSRMSTATIVQRHL